MGWVGVCGRGGWDEVSTPQPSSPLKPSHSHFIHLSLLLLLLLLTYGFLIAMLLLLSTTHLTSITGMIVPVGCHGNDFVFATAEERAKGERGPGGKQPKHTHTLTDYRGIRFIIIFSQITFYLPYKHTRQATPLLTKIINYLWEMARALSNIQCVGFGVRHQYSRSDIIFISLSFPSFYPSCRPQAQPTQSSSFILYSMPTSFFVLKRSQ